MYFTLETLQTNHRWLIMGSYLCKTLRFAGDQCTGKDCPTGLVMPPGRAKSLQNHCNFLLFSHFEGLQNMKSLKNIGISIRIENRNRCKSCGANKIIEKTLEISLRIENDHFVMKSSKFIVITKPLKNLWFLPSD